MPWPAERGLWLVLGVPWVVGTLLGRDPGRSVWLGLALSAALVAREPFLWALWCRRRSLPPPRAWARSAAWGLLALPTAAIWAVRGAAGSATALAGAGLVAAAAFEAAVRVADARAWWAGVPAAATAAAATLVAAAGPRGAPSPAVLPAALAVGYLAALSMVVVGLSLERVPRRPSGRRREGAVRWLWGWSVLAGGALLLVGARAGAGPLAAASLGLGWWHAFRAWRRPRTLDFRRLGRQEALWLCGAAAGVATLALSGLGR